MQGAVASKTRIDRGAERRFRSRLALARDDVEEVPMLGLAVGGDRVGLLFLEQLDGKPAQEVPCSGAVAMGDAGIATRLVSLAEELAGEASACLERIGDPRPERREMLWRTKRQREAGIDK